MPARRFLPSPFFAPLALVIRAEASRIRAFGYRSLFLTGASLIAAATLLFWAYVRAPRGELARYAAADTAR